MRFESGKIRLSASDLMRFMACAHATRLDLAHLQGEELNPVEDSEDAILLQQHGDRHETSYLRQLQAEGREVVQIDTERLSFEEAVRATKQALNDGPHIVYQGALEGGMWGGYADFFERVPVSSELGPFSYEITDTKLKRKPTPGHVLQLVLYSDLLAELQGHAPLQAHVQLGTGERVSFRLSEYSDYARLARQRLEQFVRNPPQTRPVPCSLCDLCRWRVKCAGEWQEEDSLFLTAGITKSQVAKLEAAGIETMSSLAGHGGRVPRLADATTEKLRTQAALQNARRTGDPAFALRPHVAGKGFDLLPRPDMGDLFYDIEGDPFYSESGSDGLEYLQGVWDGEAFTALWSHNLAEEKTTLASLFSLFEEHLGQHPNAHVYHYAAYEITALRKLATRHGIGESQLDRWLRERRFVDLYAVVRGGLFASEPSYSLKDMEVFYDMAREGEITSAAGSIVAYEKWRDTGENAILARIGDYNRIDCISVERLRDWLLTVRPEGPWLEMGEGETERSAEQEAENEELVGLLESSNLSELRQRALYDLGIFHWRESKPQAWSVFDSAAKDFEDLSEDMECLAGLIAVGGPYRVKRSTGREFIYPPQETKLREGSNAQFASEDGFVSVEITDLDRSSRQVSLKMGPRWGTSIPDELDLLPNFALNPRPIPGAIRKVIAGPMRSQIQSSG